MRFWASALVLVSLTACSVMPAVAPMPAAMVAGLSRSAATAAPKIYNFAKVNDRLYRGGQPDDADLAALVKLGVKSVVSLQGDSADEKPVVAHEKDAAAKVGLSWINMQTPLGKAPDQAFIAAFFQYVQDPAHQPVFVHCRAGKDRTGTMIALWRIQFDGYTPQQALAEMKTFGHNPSDFPYYDAAVAAFKPLPGFGAAVARLR